MAVFIPRFRSFAEKAKNPILAIIAIFGIIYLIPKVISLNDQSVGNGLDFRYIWLAGKIWASGHDPYGPLFEREYNDNFNLVLAPRLLWVYPPYWYPLALPFGLFSFQIANVIWKICNFSLLIGATHLIARALADIARQGYWPIFLAGIGFACLMQATVFALFFGQTSILVYFGLAGIFFGLLEARPLLLIIGLVFLALKPQIGIVVFPATIALHRYRWTVFAAGGVCLLATAPVAFLGDYGASIKEFLANLKEYYGIFPNTPPSMTGLINITAYVLTNSVVSSSTLIFVLVATILAVITFYNLPLNKVSEVDDTQCLVARLGFFLASTFFFLPLHSYDLVALTALMMIIMTTTLAGRYLIAFGLFVCFRPRKLYDVFDFANSNGLLFPESRLVSAGLLLVFVGALWAVIVAMPRQIEAPVSQD
jgi:hypothetical protein